MDKFKYQCIVNIIVNISDDISSTPLSQMMVYPEIVSLLRTSLS